MTKSMIMNASAKPMQCLAELYVSGGHPQHIPVIRPAPPRGCETILIVEDETPVRLLMSLALQRQGYHVLEAEDEDVASHLAALHGSTIKLLLTDINISSPNSGFYLAEALQMSNPHLRILYTSGIDPDCDVDSSGPIVPGRF